MDESGCDSDNGSAVDNLSDFSDTPSTPAESGTSDDEFIGSNLEDDDGIAVEWDVMDLAVDVEMELGGVVGIAGAMDEQPPVDDDQVVPDVLMVTDKLPPDEEWKPLRRLPPSYHRLLFPNFPSCLSIWSDRKLSIFIYLIYVVVRLIDSFSTFPKVFYYLWISKFYMVDCVLYVHSLLYLCILLSFSKISSGWVSTI